MKQRNAWRKQTVRIKALAWTLPAVLALSAPANLRAGETEASLVQPAKAGTEASLVQPAEAGTEASLIQPAEAETEASLVQPAKAGTERGPEALSEITPGTKTRNGSEVLSESDPDAGQENSTDSVAKSSLARLPSRYNLAEMGKKPVVRSQGNTGTCWAISSVSALESDLLPGSDLVFSADHMSLNNGFSLTQEDGGDYYMIMSYLADWKGPVLEEEDPYGDGVSPDGLNAAVHVQEIRLLKGMSQNAIKRMILTYGAAQSSLCMNRERTDTDDYHFYNAAESAYFDPLMENVDHDILILGWDDDYPKENFRIQPPENGAWICQNTWGESFGEDGLFYVSYEDQNLFRKGGVVYNRIEGIDNYDHVYENDSLGWQGRQGYTEDSCYFAGAFTAKAEESLSAVGLYSTGPDTVCRIYVIPEFTDAEDLRALSDMEAGVETGSESDLGSVTKAGSGIICAASGRFDTAGYYTVDLEEEIPLEAGHQFAVAVWIETENETKPVAVEMIKDQYTQNVTFEGRQTWISPDGRSWEQTQDTYGTNVCLKAYTKDREP